MAFSSIKQLELGAVISFKSKNPNDINVYQGILESVGTYRSVKGRGDQAAYNEAVRQSDPLVPSDETQLTYFLLTIDNNSADTTTVVFADEWIEPGSLEQINLGNRVTIIVDDPRNNSLRIISHLATAGYKASITSNR